MPVLRRTIRIGVVAMENESDMNRWIGGGWKIFCRLIFLWMAVDGRNKMELKQI
jgi:hypothetical protein